jgi:hypothetical protein
MKCVAEDGADGKRRRCDAGEFATQRGALYFSYKLAETQAGAARPRTRDRLVAPARVERAARKHSHTTGLRRRHL